MGRFAIEFDIANYEDILAQRKKKLAPEKVRRRRISGVIDPGATRLVLPQTVAKDLGLPVTGKVKVRYADGRRSLRKEAEGAYVTIQGRSGDFKAVLEKNRSTALIGAIVLEDLDFLVDCSKQRLVPRDPDFVLNEIE